jgi:aryl-alcohol dehydrogenase-like predicted oxidoreductase
MSIPQLAKRSLGKNGPHVTAIGFGTMGLSGKQANNNPNECLSLSASSFLNFPRLNPP